MAIPETQLKTWVDQAQILAAQIILAHSHPSGDPKPSEDDIEITKRLTEAGKMMGVEVMDHVIVSKNNYFSFKEKKLI